MPGFPFCACRIFVSGTVFRLCVKTYRSDPLTLELHLCLGFDATSASSGINALRPRPRPTFHTRGIHALAILEEKKKSYICSWTVHHLKPNLRAPLVASQLVDQLIAESANDMTILMYAARAGDQMAFKAVVKWCTRMLRPAEASLETNAFGERGGVCVAAAVGPVHELVIAAFCDCLLRMSTKYSQRAYPGSCVAGFDWLA